MLKSLKKKMKDQAGLTLIELLVVIVILGIIAAVAIPMVMSNKDDAAKSTNAQNLTILQDAVNRYTTLNDGPPASLDTLLLAESGNSNIGGPFLDSKPSIKTFTDCSGNFELNGSKKVVITATTSGDKTAACTQ
ncbi:type II secretion system protein [Robertmurraya sp. P23]|uniref:type II secretion system protein n=1 Tax=Robertmurraya sp. P23 TaxID=3436931 RepID=UPI003D97BD07